MAVYDKDVTYQYLAEDGSEKDPRGSTKTVVTDLDNSFIPLPSVKHMPLIKANFQYLYHTTQQNWDFSWHTFFWESFNSVCITAIICALAFNVGSGANIHHQDGHSYDYWNVSFIIYGSLVFVTNVAIVMRSGQLTWFVVFWIVAFSIVPFLVVEALFDTVMSITNGMQQTMPTMGMTGHYYLIYFAVTAIAFLFEFMRKLTQVMWRPRLSDYFRLLINRGLEDKPCYFDKDWLASFSQLKDPIQKHKLGNTKKVRENLSGSSLNINQEQPQDLRMSPLDEESKKLTDNMRKRSSNAKPEQQASEMNREYSSDSKPPGKVHPYDTNGRYRRQSLGQQSQIQISKLPIEGEGDRRSLSRKRSLSPNKSVREPVILPPIQPDFKKKQSAQQA